MQKRRIGPGLFALRSHLFPVCSGSVLFCSGSVHPSHAILHGRSAPGAWRSLSVHGAVLASFHRSSRIFQPTFPNSASRKMILASGLGKPRNIAWKNSLGFCRTFCILCLTLSQFCGIILGYNREVCASMTAGEWWLLTILLLAHVEATPTWNKADRVFLYQMVNELSISEEAMPSPAAQKWLLSIKREVDRESKSHRR